MKNKEVNTVLTALSKVSGLKDPKLCYAVNKTKRLLTPVIEDLQKSVQEAIAQSDDYKKYDEKRIEICEKFAKKDDKGKPISIPLRNGASTYDFDRAVEEELQAELKELSNEYKEALDEVQEKKDRHEETMEEECEVKVHNIKPEDFKSLAKDTDNKNMQTNVDALMYLLPEGVDPVWV